MREAVGCRIERTVRDSGRKESSASGKQRRRPAMNTRGGDNNKNTTVPVTTATTQNQAVNLFPLGSTMGVFIKFKLV